MKAPKASELSGVDHAKVQPFRTFARNTVALLTEKKWLYTVYTIGCQSMFIMFGFLYYLSSILENQYRIDGIKKGLILALPLSAICLSSYITGKIVGENKRRMKVLCVIGLFVLMASILACGILNATNLWSLISLLFFSGIGIGLVLPSLDALITEGIEKKQRGTITSLYSSARFIGVALGPLIASVMRDKPLFFLFTGCALLSLILAIFTIKPHSQRKTTA